MPRKTEDKIEDKTAELDGTDAETTDSEEVEADESADTSKMTPEQRDKHRERVKLSAAARQAAVKRLVEAHKAEYDKYHEEEKDKLGIKSRTAAKAERERQKFLQMLADNPDFAALIEAQKASASEAA